MKANVGSIDRIARVGLGLTLLSIVFLGTGPARWFGLIGIVPLLTASMGFCPLYTVIGFNTGATGDNE